LSDNSNLRHHIVAKHLNEDRKKTGRRAKQEDESDELSSEDMEFVQEEGSSEEANEVALAPPTFTLEEERTPDSEEMVVDEPEPEPEEELSEDVKLLLEFKYRALSEVIAQGRPFLSLSLKSTVNGANSFSVPTPAPTSSLPAASKSTEVPYPTPPHIVPSQPRLPGIHELLSPSKPIPSIPPTGGLGSFSFNLIGPYRPGHSQKSSTSGITVQPKDSGVPGNFRHYPIVGSTRNGFYHDPPERSFRDPPPTFSTSTSSGRTHLPSISTMELNHHDRWHGSQKNYFPSDTQAGHDKYPQKVEHFWSTSSRFPISNERCS
jgi:hypothetical protein